MLTPDFGRKKIVIKVVLDETVLNIKVLHLVEANNFVFLSHLNPRS